MSFALESPPQKMMAGSSRQAGANDADASSKWFCGKSYERANMSKVVARRKVLEALTSAHTLAPGKCKAASQYGSCDGELNSTTTRAHQHSSCPSPPEVWKESIARRNGTTDI